MNRLRTLSHAVVASALLALPIFSLAQTHPTGVPTLSSRTGAAYTIYLDFNGFSFTGNWGNVASQTPGVTPAYDGQTTAFTATEITNINAVWSRVAEKYAPFDVNVTTVDPAVAAQQNASDATRQAFYDNTAQLMHTVIGGNGSWSGGGGISYVGVTPNTYAPGMVNGGAGYGYKTDFIFSAEASTNTQFIGEAASHENGHGFGLLHQSDYQTDGTFVNEYSSNGNATGNGSFAPTMGNSYSSQRGTWRLGNSRINGAEATQNDVASIVTDPNNSFVDDGVGHSLVTATAIPLTGTLVNAGLAKGIIVPTATALANPIGASNYTTDYFKFRSTGGGFSLTAFDGSERLVTGIADPGITLRSTLNILDANGTVVGTATEDASTLFETFTGTLAAGNYFAKVASIGGYTSTFDTSAKYYTEGSFFLTGSGLAAPVPEPMTMLGLAVGVAAFARRRRK